MQSYMHKVVQRVLDIEIAKNSSEGFKKSYQLCKKNPCSKFATNLCRKFEILLKIVEKYAESAQHQYKKPL